MMTSKWLRVDMSPPAWLRRIHAWPLALLMLLGLILLAVGVGLRDPWPADEPRFVLNALEMLKTGQFWIPHRAGELYPDKPPIFMWFSAAAIQLTGSVRIGFMLPSLLGALGTLALVVDLSRRLYGRRIAWLAGLTLLASFQFELQARTAQIDMLLNLWVSLGVYGVLRHVLLGPAIQWWYIACIAMGLGVLTKGVGFLPLLLLPAVWILARQGRVEGISLRELLIGIALLIGILVLWVGPMVIYTSFSGNEALVAYRDNILFKQTGDRYASSWHHIKPWYFYLVEVAPWAWLPMTLGLPWLMPAWYRRVRRVDPRVILPLSAALLIILFFSLSPGKRGVYLLPVTPLLVIAAAPVLSGLLCIRRLQGLALLLLSFLAMAFLVAGVLGAFGFPVLEALATRHDIQPWWWWGALGCSGVVLSIGLRHGKGMIALVLWLGLFWLSWSTWGYRLMNEARSPYDFMRHVEQFTGAGQWLAIPDFDEEFVLQAHQPLVHFGYHTPDDVQFLTAFGWLKADPDERWLLVSQEQRDELACADLSQAMDMGTQNSEDWWLLSGRAFVRCYGDTRAAPIFSVPVPITSDFSGSE